MDPNLRLDSWYWVCRGLILNHEHGRWISRQERIRTVRAPPMGTPIEDRIVSCLEWDHYGPSFSGEIHRFECRRINECTYEITDHEMGIRVHLPVSRVMTPNFNVVQWYAQQLKRIFVEMVPEFEQRKFQDDDSDDDNNSNNGQISTVMRQPRVGSPYPTDTCNNQPSRSCSVQSMIMGPQEIEVFGIEIPRVVPPKDCISALQQNAAMTKDFTQLIPKPIIVVVHIEGQPARALIDTGSLADFMSLNLAEQLKVPKKQLKKPLTIQLVVQGSRSKVNYGVNAQIQYQGTDYKRYFDVINLQHYDLILGTPFLFQHKIMIGFNSPRVVLGSTDPLPIEGTQVSTLESRATEIYSEQIDRAREYLLKMAKPLCTPAGATILPPLREINHTIPLVDENKVYTWRPSRCPEALRPAWIEKKNVYLRSGRWKMTTTRNTCPMLLIPKVGSPTRLRVVVDL